MRVNYYILLLPSLKKGEKKYETKQQKNDGKTLGVLLKKRALWQE